MTATALTPGDSGRRSRRGYAYQDAVTLLDCLDMHNDLFDEVGFEDLDDIMCLLHGNPTYRQVKTKEDGTRHSLATICAPEKRDQFETSILGRLFLNKPLTADTRFSLVLNETPTPELGAFCIQRGDPCGSAPEGYQQYIANKLGALPLAEGKDIYWYISRLDVIIEPRTIDEVEQKLLKRLVEPVAQLLEAPPLYSELVEILIGLSTFVARDAWAPASTRWDASLFAAKLQSLVTWATGRRSDGTIEPLPSLAEKLRPAGIPPQEALAQTDAMLRYRRRYRSSVGQEREYFDTLNDHVHAVCTQVSADRRASRTLDAPATYAATVARVSIIEPYDGKPVPLPDKLAALSDVTARCQNRYTDDT